VEPDASEPVVHFRVAAERFHHVDAQQPFRGGRHQRAEIRQGPVQQPVGDTDRSALLRRVLVPDQEHSRGEHRANHPTGGAPSVQSVSGQVRSHYR